MISHIIVKQDKLKIMKKSRLFLGLLFGLIIIGALFFVISCKSEPTISKTISKPPLSTLIKEYDSYTKVYKLDVDDIQYIVVVNDQNGGVAIIQHKR
jgi:hypothetical protein